ncbi:Proline dipeptidase [Bacillus cereus AH1272]|nr:Proline dipeptidase [Bacillus cereus AH1272]
MNLRINKIQNQLQKYEIDGLLITKKKIANMQQALQAALASS